MNLAISFADYMYSDWDGLYERMEMEVTGIGGPLNNKKHWTMFGFSYLALRTHFCPSLANVLAMTPNASLVFEISCCNVMTFGEVVLREGNSDHW